MALISDSICAICCERFSKSQSNFDHLFHFQKLCSSLNVAETVGGATTTASAKIKSENRRERKLKSSFISARENKLIQVICRRCLVSVSSTLIKRDQLNGLELEVRQLQMKILELLNKLQGSVKTFKMEVRKMQGIVEGSRGSIRNLDSFYCSDKEEADKKGPGLQRDVIQFREKVLAVFEDLRNFSNNLEVFSTSADCTTTDHSSVEVINNITLHDRSMMNRQSQGKNPAHMETPIIAETEETASDGDDVNYAHDLMEGSPDSATDSLDNDYCLDAYQSHDGNSTAQNSDIDGNVAEPKTDDEFTPTANSLNSSENKKSNSSTEGSLLQSIDFSKMTTFKKNLISRITKKREKLQKAQQRNKCDSKNQHKTPQQLLMDEIDPRNYCFVNYDPKETNTLILGDVKINIDEQEESLQCTKCDFKCYQTKTKPGFHFDNKMYNHVVGRHLKLYACPHCSRDRFSNIRKFRMHLYSHTNRYACDICGKPLSDTYSLKKHKWLHLNEQEKAEAVKNGEKPPDETYRQVKQSGQRNHQCSTCGKRFIFPNDLKRHEKDMHQQQSTRPHMCSQCGKAFKGRNGLTNHLKFVCYPDKGKVPVRTVKRFQCDQCPTTLRFPGELKRHKKVVHSSELLYKCSICEKMFKTKSTVKTHELIHSDARPFLCAKGCGAAFKDRSNCSRHEKKCGNG